MYASLGLSNIIPMTHLVCLSFLASPSNDYMPFNDSYIWILIVGGLYLIGLAFYATRFPERIWKETFDIWLNSHTIWHIFVFLAALTHFYAICKIYQTRLLTPCLS